jgi:DNA polymerase (family 10)
MPVHNEDIAAIFDEIADLLEIQDANPFRVRAYRNGARTVRGLGQDLGEWVHEDRDLTRLPGIGKDLAQKIKEIHHTGSSSALKELHKEIPASLEQLLKIPGLGPKRVKALYKDLGIETLSQLEQAALSGRLATLPGFGDKTQQRVVEVIASHREKKRRFLRATAMEYAEPLVAYLRQTPGIKEVVVAGSYRRGKETVGDLDVLATAGPKTLVMERFTTYDEVTEAVSQGPTRATVILRCGLQVDLRAVEAPSFGAALHYFTGSKAHNIQIRRLGQQAGLKINEYGVFRGERRVAGRTEASVFRSVGLPYIEPELREGQGEVEAAREGALPQLVALSDLKGNLHTHTTASDGQAGLEEMVLAAQALGLDYLAITDHSRHLTVANGLTPERLAAQMEEIDALNERIPGITVLKGIEVDILEDGRLDLPNRALKGLDLVVGAVHSHFGLSRMRQTERILRAMDNPYFSILAHPSGRLLLERDPYDVDMGQLIDHARQRGCFLELNAQPERLDLTDTYCRLAKAEGVRMSLASDAHSEQQLNHLRLGIAQARRGWLEADDVINTRPLSKLRALLRQTMG